jgi:hypothetical protein
LDASGKDKKRLTGRRTKSSEAGATDQPASSTLIQSSIAAQLIAVSFGGQVLGRRIHGVSSDNWRR